MGRKKKNDRSLLPSSFRPERTQICNGRAYPHSTSNNAVLQAFDVWNSQLNTAITVLCYISSCANPITYCFLNKKFRTALLLSFGCHKSAIRRHHFHRVYSPPNGADDNVAPVYKADGDCAPGAAGKLVAFRTFLRKYSAYQHPRLLLTIFPSQKLTD